MKRQKGQDIVEFALLLPIFLLVLCGIIYCGFMFGDYQTVQGIVRNAAREAAVVEPTRDETNPTELKYDYQKIKDKYDEILKNENVITHLYVPDVSGENGIRIDLGSHLKTTLPDARIPDDSVGAVLTMKLTTSDISFVNYMKNVVGIPKEYTVSCFMYREKTST